jgi:hypothetical protein
MNPDFFGLIEVVLIFGIVFAFGVWQLAALSRLKKRRSAPVAGDGGEDSAG